MTHKRWTDKVLFFVAILGPLCGFLFGMIKTGQRIQVIEDDHANVLNIMVWKEKQEDFNRVIIGQIAELKSLHRRQ